jgi:hypothetical protein
MARQSERALHKPSREKKSVKSNKVMWAVLVILMFGLIQSALVPRSFADSQGPNYGNVAVNDTTVGVAAYYWTNYGSSFPSDDTHASMVLVTNALTADSSYATSPPCASGPTAYLRITGFAFSLPSNSIINGIDVTVWAYNAYSASYPAYFSNVRLYTAGYVGNTKTSGNIPGPTAASGVTFDFGSSTDTWGYTWTASQINSQKFGVGVSVTGTATNSASVMLDYVRITVYWSSYSVTFATNIGSLGSDSSGTVVTVNGVAETQGGLTSTTASTITYGFTQIVPSTTVGKQYVFVSLTGGTPAQSMASATFNPTAAGTIIATYKTQYLLITGVYPSGAGSVSISTAWYDSGTSITTLTATANSGYALSAWSDGTTASTHASFTMSAATTLIANFVGPSYTLTVSSAYGSPAPTSGSYSGSVTARVNSPLSGTAGVQYVCTGWTGTGSVPASGAGTSVTFTITQLSTITWQWKTQYLLTIQTNPAGGTVTPSVTGPPFWFDSGTAVTLTATVPSGYNFNGWTGSYTGTGTTLTVPSTASGPVTEVANFVSSSVQVTVTSYTAIGSGFLTVDGVAYDTPHVFSWTAGSLHTLVASSPVSCPGITGCQYVFVQWSDGTTATTHSYTTPSTGPAAVTAIYKTQYQVTIGVTAMSAPTLTLSTPLLLPPSKTTTEEEAPHHTFRYLCNVKS